MRTSEMGKILTTAFLAWPHFVVTEPMIRLWCDSFPSMTPTEFWEVMRTTLKSHTGNFPPTIGQVYATLDRMQGADDLTDGEASGGTHPARRANTCAPREGIAWLLRCGRLGGQTCARGRPRTKPLTVRTFGKSTAACAPAMSSKRRLCRYQSQSPRWVCLRWRNETNGQSRNHYGPQALRARGQLLPRRQRPTLRLQARETLLPTPPRCLVLDTAAAGRS
jgi:hypothetical protein